jgi:hypothetical protein
MSYVVDGREYPLPEADRTTGLAVTCDTSQVKSFPVVGKNFIFKEELLMISCVSTQVR